MAFEEAVGTQHKFRDFAERLSGGDWPNMAKQHQMHWLIEKLIFNGDTMGFSWI